ncbi:MAG TPA: aminotransferase class I/II-fold pyridoxal phosphate-dependent enzyme [Gemmatimonadales bacterium]|nr:aminotransferase class I/II-fold pyridoxal phosphate-dependent enzyme [Gemmatimonadales bacterium]
MTPAPVDPFDGFFEDGAGAEAPGGLLDHERARRWLELVGWGSRTGLYTYQIPLDGRCGPHVTVGGRRMLMLSAYDYLGLIGHPAVERAAVEAVRRHGTGSGGVRLLTGTTAAHRELERELAAFKRTPAAVAFSSGYMATLGVVGALLGPDDRVVLDACAHRSVIDACHLARVPFRPFRHNDPAALEEALRRGPRARRTLIVVEGIYSMDGDVCPLPAIVELKRRYGAFLMVDEAHSFGVLGASGRGVDEECGVASSDVDVWMGSLSKAIPSNGGFLAGGRALIYYLQHGAAPFMFSAALCPAAAAAAAESLRVLAAEPERLARLRDNAARLRAGLQETGYDTGASSTPIVPVMLGSDEAAFRTARRLFDLGILASAVIPPAVPHGAARLRLCATAAHARADIDDALEAFAGLRAGHRALAGVGPA